MGTPKRDTLNGNASRLRPHHLGHVLYVGEITGRRTAPPKTKVLEVDPLSPGSRLMGRGAFHIGSCPYHHSGAPSDSKCRRTTYPLPPDMGATFSVLLSNPGPPSNKSATIHGISGKSVTKFFTRPLRCDWESIFFSHAFLIVPESPTPLLGRDILSKVKASIYRAVEPLQGLCLPLMKEILTQKSGS